MVVVDARGPQRELALGGAPFGVGEQRVVADPGGEQTLGQPAHEDPIEIEAQPQGDVAHQQTVAEPADAPQVGVELQLERAPEHRQPRVRLDRVEAGEAGQRRLHLLRRPPLDLGPVGPPRLRREVVVHEALGPTREVAPAAAGSTARSSTSVATKSCSARVAASSASKCSGCGSRSVTARSAASSNSDVRGVAVEALVPLLGPRTISAVRLIFSQPPPAPPGPGGTPAPTRGGA